MDSSLIETNSISGNSTTQNTPNQEATNTQSNVPNMLLDFSENINNSTSKVGKSTFYDLKSKHSSILELLEKK